MYFMQQYWWAIDGVSAKLFHQMYWRAANILGRRDTNIIKRRYIILKTD